ncbi:MAG: sugar phosphate nucleotidyltransferase [archaeon]
MNKTKVAISIDKPLLDLIDSKIDGTVIRSRSQAMEFFLRKGIGEQTIKEAVMLVHSKDFDLLLAPFNGTTLIRKHLDFLNDNKIKKLYMVTTKNEKIDLLKKEISNSKVEVELIFEKEAKGTASALNAVKDHIKNDFIVMNGDTYNNFNLIKMINKHSETNKIATMGIMTSSEPSKYMSVTLEGDTVIFVQDKQKTGYIINAGIYIFKPEIFNYTKNAHSLELEVLPKLTQMNSLQAYFTYGEYKHFE